MLSTMGNDRQRMALWLRLSIFAVIGCGIAIVGVAAFLYFEQHSMIYHPRPYPNPVAKALPANVVELEYTLPFGEQTAFYIPLGSEPPRRIWIAFCGNGSLALNWLASLAHYPKNGDAFLLIDYPGYGKNSGYATIGSTRATTEGALRALAERLHVDIATVDLGVLGHSLGAAAALDLAAHRHVRRIVLIAPFTSLREEAATVVGSSLSHLLIENYDNRENLRAILQNDPATRVTIFHGSDDQTIPVRMGRALAREFPAVDYHEVNGADHITVLDDAASEIIRAMTR